VKAYPDAPLFAPEVVRTVFLDFDVANWEEELELFHNTDADVPARMTVDGRTIEGVGVHFRGASSYMMVPRGTKRSFNIAVDHTDGKAALYGQNTLNFLNCNGDASFMSAVLYAHLARPHIAAPRANFVHVVVNGESWGLFANVEQFNKAFLREHWPDFKGDGARWKVKGSPNATGGLDHRGEDLAAYRQRYEIKTKDSEKDWKALVTLCRTLSKTPIDELEAALTPMLDLDGALWFLALDIVTANSDGYWTRASDYSLYRDPKGVFHIVPHDMNEAFKLAHGGPGGPGGRGGPGGGGAPAGRPGRGMRPRPADADAPPPQSAPGAVRGQDTRPAEGAAPQRGARGGSVVELDPLSGLDDPTKPLRSRLLQVPALRAKYLGFVKQLAAEMAWEKTGPLVASQRALVEKLVAQDTRKAFTTDAFERDTSPEPTGTLRQFFEKRSKYLLEYQPKGVAPAKKD
jgi:spore coat protein CotH